MTDLIITKLERHEGPRPYWTARVHHGGEHLDVDNRYGSWQPDVPAQVQQYVVGGQVMETVVGPRRSFVVPEVAAALQAKLPRTERGRR